jgi:two-component system alkaline phosphatase synthesis response regulator PhoP
VLVRSRVLVVDDDTDLIGLVTSFLEKRGMVVVSAIDGSEALRKLPDCQPDLVILDLMMPGMDGWQVCQAIRRKSDVPVMVLTARRQERDILRSFAVGADDYLVKPFSISELEARVLALLRRSRAREEWGHASYSDDRLNIDLLERRVLREGRNVHLTETEFDLLSCLVRRQGSVVAHNDLVREVWGVHYIGGRDALSLYIHYLRKKLEADPRAPQYIQTQRGVGYWFGVN